MITFILIIIIIFVIIFIARSFNYKNYLTDLQNSRKEHFTSKQKKTNKEKILDKKLPANPQIVFCDYEGNTIFIKNNKVWKIDCNNKIIFSNKNINEELNIPYSINIKTGTLENKNLILITHENKVLEYDIIDKEKISENNLSDYFLDVNEDIESILYYSNKFYLFSGNDVLIYDKKSDKMIEKYLSNKLFKNMPSNINCAYVNHNILYKNKDTTHGTPCFIKNRNMYIYDKEKNKTYLIDTNYGFINNTEYFVIKFNNQKASFTPPKKGYYRIITIGAGNEGGGFGGMVYNDYELSKKDKLDIIVGQSGERLPLKDKIITYDKLPYVGSSAGSGGSYVYKKNKLIQCSGGGGGWTSEIIKAPNMCNSRFSVKKQNNKIVIPIKKLVLVTKNTNYHKTNNIRQQIIVKDLVLDIFNYTQVDFNVETTPQSSINKYKYETGFSNHNNICSITITFSKVLSDYNLMLDAFVNSTNNDKNYFDLHIYDEQDRKIVINDYNKNYNNVSLNSSKIISSFVKYPNTLNNNINVKSGNKTATNLDDIFKGKKYSDDDNTLEYPLIKLNGGIGGGGDSVSNKSKKILVCGGGGGYEGGEHTSLSESFINECSKKLNLEYIAGCGGLSYVKDGKFNKNNYINDYNNKDGVVIIIRINDLQTFSEIEDVSDKYLENNDKMIKPNSVIDIKKFSSNKFDNLHEFNRPSIHNDIRFDTINYKIFTVNEILNPGVNYFKVKINKSFDRNKIFVKTDKNVDIMFLYLSLDNMERIMFKDDQIKTDNILSLNHGFINPSLLNIFSFFENLIKYNIYKYNNNISFKDLNKKEISYDKKNIKTLFEHKKFVYENINSLYIDNNINKLKKADYLYILIKNKKQNKSNNIRCNIVQYNLKNNTLNDSDFKYQISNL